MYVRKVKDLENEFVERFSKLLSDLFSSNLPIGFDISYYMGENEEDVRGLYLEIISKGVGIIYARFQEMKPWETPYDHEEAFISQVTSDLMMAGVTFINMEKYHHNMKGTPLKASRKIFMN